MRPPPGLKSKMLSRSGRGKRGLVLSERQKEIYYSEDKEIRDLGWPVRDYTMPCSLPNHKKIMVASHKAFELCDYYSELTKGDGGIRDPCINVMYKVTSSDAPKYWSTGMMGMENFRKLYTQKRLAQIIENSLTQNYDMSGEGRVDFNFQIMWREPAGCCCRGDVPVELLKKDSVFKVYNDDGRCGQRCIAMFFLLQKSRKDMHRYYTVPKRAALWEQATRNVCDKIDHFVGMCFSDFQRVTDEFGFIVELFDWSEKRGAQFLMRTHVKDDNLSEKESTAQRVHNKGCISILVQQIPEGEDYRMHYHLINNIDAVQYLVKETGQHTYRYCQPCAKKFRYDNFNKHQCKGLRCGDCTKVFATKAHLVKHLAIVDHRNCLDCNRLLRHGEECVEAHSNPKCKGGGYWFCYEKNPNNGDINVNRIPKSRLESHVCGEVQCPNCSEWLPPDGAWQKEILFKHNCLVKEKKKLSEKQVVQNQMRSIYMADCESLLIVDESETSLRTHEPFYIFVKQMEYLAFPEGDLHHKENYFSCEGPGCMLELFRWAQAQKEPSVVLFHNGAAYDTLMFLRDLRSVLTEDDEMPIPITAGTRIMSLKVGCVTFQDSILHMGVACAKIPTTYGFEKLNGEEIAKGYCPYQWYDRWEKVCNENGSLYKKGECPDEFINDLKGKPPALEFFPDSVLEEKFYKWYDSFDESNPWDPMEVIPYCQQDVKIQCLGAQRHRRIFFDLTNTEKGSGIDVFCGSFPTLASACSRAFLQNMYDSEKNPMYSLTEDLDKSIRSAGGGGNVNAVRGALDIPFERMLKGECIKYGDFMSLYPWCMIKTPMCIGPPRVTDFTKDNQPPPELVKKVFGYIQCDAEPPPDLFHPVLLRNNEGFLINSLEPILNRTHSSVEIQLAIEKKYKVTNIRKLIEFDKSDTLFKKYIHRFMRKKIESEGYSNKAHVKAVCVKYCGEFELTLDEAAMLEDGNPGLRQVAKLILNCLWGRLMMDLQKRKTEKYCSREELADFCGKIHDQSANDPRRVQLDLQMPVSDSCYLVKYKGEFGHGSTKNQFGMQPMHYSIAPATAAFVAAQGRVKLYRDLLDPLGERVLYNDTDSCIWHYVPGEFSPTFSKNPVFGDITDETHGVPIMRYRGPTSKTYAVEFPSMEQCLLLNESPDYVRCHGKIIFTKEALKLIENRYLIKCKGFTLKSTIAKKTLTFEEIERLMHLDSQAVAGDDFHKQKKAVVQEKWDRSGHDTISTSTKDKKFSVPIAGNAKRVRIDPSNEFSLQYPWGHKLIKLDSQAYKKARIGLIVDGRLKAKNEAERLEFCKIRKLHA